MNRHRICLKYYGGLDVDLSGLGKAGQGSEQRHSDIYAIEPAASCFAPSCAGPSEKFPSLRWLRETK